MQSTNLLPFNGARLFRLADLFAEVGVPGGAGLEQRRPAAFRVQFVQLDTAGVQSRLRCHLRLLGVLELGRRVRQLGPDLADALLELLQVRSECLASLGIASGVLRMVPGDELAARPLLDRRLQMRLQNLLLIVESLLSAFEERNLRLDIRQGFSDGRRLRMCLCNV